MWHILCLDEVVWLPISENTWMSVELKDAGGTGGAGGAGGV